MRRLWLALVGLAALLGAAAAANAHEVRPAFLQVVETAPSRFEVTWKQPVAGELALRLTPELSNGWLARPPADDFVTPAFRIRSWRIAATGDPLSGRTLSVAGLERSITDVLVSVRLADGRRFETILKPDRPSAAITFAAPGAGLAAPAYFGLGVEHILTGIDHLMFVLGLLLLVGVRWRLVKAITAFTLAHSLTLGASALGWAAAPAAVIEALVALSIVFVAAELASGRRERGLTARHPWLVAFVFGLLHGFAFAGALSEVGLPKDAIPQALLLFNLGVEAGQLLFVGAAILAILALRPLRARLPAAWARLAPRLPPYAIGAFAAFWFLERTAAAFA